MAGSRTKRAAEVDSLSVIMAKNARKKLAELGWSLGELARRSGWKYSELKRYFNLGRYGYKQWPTRLARDAALALDMTILELAGMSPTRDGTWNPQFQNSPVLLDKFSEHQRASSQFFTFNRFLPCSWMTETVQSRHYLSLFGPLLGDEQGLAMAETYNAFGSARREAFLSCPTGSPIEAVTLMLRSDFQKLIDREPPFDECKPEHIMECLEYLRRECIQRRGSQLLFLDDSKLPPRLEFMLRPLDSFLLIGDTLYVDRATNFLVNWSERRADIESAGKLLRELMNSVDIEPTSRAMIGEIEGYMRRAERSLDGNPETGKSSST